MALSWVQAMREEGSAERRGRPAATRSAWGRSAAGARRLVAGRRRGGSTTLSTFRPQCRCRHSGRTASPTRAMPATALTRTSGRRQQRRRTSITREPSSASERCDAGTPRRPGASQPPRMAHCFAPFRGEYGCVPAESWPPSQAAVLAAASGRPQRLSTRGVFFVIDRARMAKGRHVRTFDNGTMNRMMDNPSFPVHPSTQ
mmetsp:Transcript_31921/g.54569  ORF Transcript_31921/g.54569 Transcript_31921/m.54569 type:complete len:201 (-) Transcript_31921:67-669(-)